MSAVLKFNNRYCLHGTKSETEFLLGLNQELKVKLL